MEIGQRNANVSWRGDSLCVKGQKERQEESIWIKISTPSSFAAQESEVSFASATINQGIFADESS